MVGAPTSEAQLTYKIALGCIVLVAQGCIVVVGASGQLRGLVEVDGGSAEVVGLALGAEASAVMVARDVDAEVTVLPELLQVIDTPVEASVIEVAPDVERWALWGGGL